MNAQAQLLGCVLHCGTAREVLTISRAVPAEAIDEPLDRAILAAAVELAERDQWDPASVARTVHLNGYPRDVHGAVTGRIVDLITECAWPSAWQEAAAEVLETYSRRRLAVLLTRAEKALSEQPLTGMAQTLTDAADVARSCGQLVAALTGEPNS